MSRWLRVAITAGIELVELAEVGEHFPRRQPLVELRVARQEADAALGGDRLGVDVEAVDQHLAAVGRQDAGQHPQRRGLAGAVGAEQPDDLAAAARRATRRRRRRPRPKRLPSDAGVEAARSCPPSDYNLTVVPNPRGAAQMAADFSGIRKVLPPVNEPIRGYAPGSPERAAIKARLASMAGERVEIPLVIGGKERPHRRPRPFGDAARPRPRAGRLPPRPARGRDRGDRRGARRRAPSGRAGPGRTGRRCSSRPPTCSPPPGATRSTPRRCSGSRRPSTRRRSTRPASSSTSGASTSRSPPS